nr:GNAT family N-acetyltransferase [Paraburkholderia fungorum]
MMPATNYPAEGVATERTILRAAHEDHATELLKYYKGNRQHLQLWEPSRPERFFELDAISERLRVMARQTSTGHALHLLMFEHEGNRLIGECNFTNIVRGPFQACHLGFSIASEFEGRGLMREGLAAAIDHTFTTLRLHRIMANYRPENIRSERLLVQLGFEKEGLARSYLQIDGAWADHVLTSKINPADFN